MHSTQSHSPAQRQRLRIACEPCRERKRKCEGNQPCSFCAKYEYDCTYRSKPRTRKSRVNGHSTGQSLSAAPGPTLDASQTIGAPAHVHASPRAHTDDPHVEDATQQHSRSTPAAQSLSRPEVSYLRPADSNSGAAFARALTLALDPTHHDKASSILRMPAWNLFLGARSDTESTLQPHTVSLANILSESDMQNLVTIYVEKVHPCYNFVPLSAVQQAITSVWVTKDCSRAREAVLCGVGALGLLFSGTADLQTEQKLVAVLKHQLNPTIADRPSLDSAVAWLLLTVYLRLTAFPEEAWLTSCTTIHMIDAAGIHSESSQSSASFPAQGAMPNADTRRRIIGVAQHLNIWMSYDLGRCHAQLHGMRAADGADTVQHALDYSEEVYGLLPSTRSLDPVNATSASELTNALLNVLSRRHTQPPSILAQCNIMLCIHRRLHALNCALSPNVLNDLLNLVQRSMQAVRDCLRLGLPWHQVSNMPFQAMCTLLALDCPESFALLSDTLDCLDNVNSVHQTGATREAVTAARALIQLHRKRREADLRRHDEMLQMYPITRTVSDQVPAQQNEPNLIESWWLNDFINDANLDFGEPFDML